MTEGTKDRNQALGDTFTSKEAMSLFAYLFISRVYGGFLMLKIYVVIAGKKLLDSVFLTREIPTYFSSSTTTHYTDIAKNKNKTP